MKNYLLFDHDGVLDVLAELSGHARISLARHRITTLAELPSIVLDAG